MRQRTESQTQRLFAEIGAVLRAQQRFAVLSHVRPDGDALGSQLALALSLCTARQRRDGLERRRVAREIQFPAGRRTAHQRRLSEPQDFDVAIALDTATQSRLGTAARARSQRQDLDQYRPPSEQSALRRSGLHRSDCARDRTDSFRIDPEPGAADGSPRSRRISSSPSPPTPARSSIRTPPRALLRSAPSWCAAAWMSGASASFFTKVIRAAASSCCANCSARCVSKRQERSPASV